MLDASRFIYRLCLYISLFSRSLTGGFGTSILICLFLSVSRCSRPVAIGFYISILICLFLSISRFSGPVAGGLDASLPVPQSGQRGQQRQQQRRPGQGSEGQRQQLNALGLRSGRAGHADLKTRIKVKICASVPASLAEAPDAPQAAAAGPAAGQEELPDHADRETPQRHVQGGRGPDEAAGAALQETAQAVFLKGQSSYQF